MKIIEECIPLSPSPPLPRKYRLLQVEYPLPDSVQPRLVYFPPGNRGDDLAFQRRVAGVVFSEPDPDDRPEEIAENGAFLGVSAVLDFFRGQGFALVGGEVGRRGAAPEIFRDSDKVIGGEECPSCPFTRLRHIHSAWVSSWTWFIGRLGSVA